LARPLHGPIAPLICPAGAHRCSLTNECASVDANRGIFLVVNPFCLSTLIQPMLFPDLLDYLQVLSDSQERVIYDQADEEGLKAQVPPTGEGGPSGSSFYGGECIDIPVQSS
jgi:hypothetical protein